MLRHDECAIEIIDVLAVEHRTGRIVAGWNILPICILVEITIPAIANEAIVEWQAPRGGPSENDSALLVDNRAGVCARHRQRVQARYGKAWGRGENDREGYEQSLHGDDPANVWIRDNCRANALFQTGRLGRDLIERGAAAPTFVQA